jgi:TonB family protein
MKQKIKIMKTKPELSDEEIGSYMDFETLVTNANRAHSSIKSYSIIKYSIPILVISAAVIWIIYNHDSTETAPGSSRIVMDEGTKPVNPPPMHDATSKEVPLPNDAGKTSAPKSENEPKKSNTPEIAPVDTKNPTSPRQDNHPATENVYIQAEPITGYTALYEYFNASLVYPEESVDNGIEGVLTVTFTVSPAGKPENIVVTQSLGEPFEKEAHRLIENMPDWKPATLNGKAVPSRISIPLTFQIKKVTVNDQP